MNVHQAKSPSILIIDDNRHFVDAFEALIIDVAGSSTFTIDKAYNGRDGLNLIRASYYNYIFIDINMPEIDGIKVTKTVDWEFFRLELNIIAISFHTEEKYIIEMLQAGAKQYLSKDQINHNTISQILKFPSN